MKWQIWGMYDYDYDSTGSTGMAWFNIQCFTCVAGCPQSISIDHVDVDLWQLMAAVSSSEQMATYSVLKIFSKYCMNYKSMLTHEGIVPDYISSHLTLDIGLLNVIIVFMTWQYTWKCDKTKTGPGYFDHVSSDMPMMFAVFSMSSESFKWWLDNRPNCLISFPNHSFRNQDF